MTHPYAMCMLLEHGALSYRELVDVTGWKPKAVYRALERTLQRGLVRRSSVPGFSHFVYELA